MILETASRRKGPGVARYLSHQDLPCPGRTSRQDSIEDSIVVCLSAGVNVHVRSRVNPAYLRQSLTSAT